MKKTKTYVLTVSRNFPVTHRRKGEPTNFVTSIFDLTKLHTIRTNYELWAKRVKEVQAGDAIISLRYWSGRPYNSDQVELIRFTHAFGIGVQKIVSWDSGLVFFESDKGAPVPIDIKTLAANDGLSLEDFEEWFKKADFEKPMAIIHFTQSRYYGSKQDTAELEFRHK